MISRIKKYLFVLIGILIIFIIFSIFLFFLKKILGFSQEKFNEIILGGFSQSVLSSVFLYFIFNELLIKRPKVRLYVEPRTIDIKDGEFSLKFYINNTGYSTAKNILLTAQFNNLEIIKFVDGNFKDISKHRGGLAAIQFDKNIGVLHAYPEIRNSYIGEILFKIKERKNRIDIKYDVVAEQMELFEDTISLKVS